MTRLNRSLKIGLAKIKIKRTTMISLATIWTRRNKSWINM